MLKIFSVYDSKAAAYLQPIFCVNAAVAIRSFEHAVNSEGHDFSRFSADYTLFELGSFDPQLGQFELHQMPHNLGTASSFLRQIKQEGN